MPTLRQLRYFVAAVEAENITRAAMTLNVAATALSLQIKALEDRLGTPLLARHSRGVAPTPAGSELVERAKRILGLVDETRRAVGGQRPLQSRQVTLGAPPGLARLVGTSAFLSVADRFPGLALQVIEGWTGDLRRKLEANEIDIVIGYGLESSEAMLATELLQDRLVFVGPPGQTDHGPISIEEAVKADLVFYGEQSLGARFLARVDGTRIAPVRHVASIGVWRELICRGAGASLAPFGVIADGYARGEFSVRDIIGPPHPVHISLGIHRSLLDEAWCAGLMECVADLVLEVPVRNAVPFKMVDAPSKGSATTKDLQNPPG